MIAAEATITTTQIVAAAVAIVAMALWGAAAVAYYGQRRGYPWWPVFICAVCLSWPIVLLALIAGEGPRRPRGEPPSRRDLESQKLVNLARITER